MSIRICTCCRTERTALHAHGKPCEVHGLAPVVSLPPSLGDPGGEDCTGSTVKTAVLVAYRVRGEIAYDLARKLYKEGNDRAPPRC